MIDARIKCVANIICDAHPTPFYLIDLDSINLKITQFRDVFKKYFPYFKIAYSYKTNALKAVAQLIARLGEGAEVVSGTELEWALLDGFASHDIYFDGPVKFSSELEKAILKSVNIQTDSLDELKLLIDIAKTHQRTPPLSLRLSTKYKGLKDSRFGLSSAEFRQAWHLVAEQGFSINGLHFHVGSNVNDPKQYIEALFSYKEEISLLLNDASQEAQPPQKWIDVGGGFPAFSFSRGGTPTPIENYAREIRTCFSDLGFSPTQFCLITEPGRCLTEDYGYLIAEIAVTKNRNGRDLAILNAGSNLVRSITNWYHPAECLKTVEHENAKSVVYDVYGANCFESDLFKQEMAIDIDESAIGTKLIFGSAGGYDIPSTNVWTRPLPPIFGILNNEICELRKAQGVHEVRSLQNALDDLPIIAHPRA